MSDKRHVINSSIFLLGMASGIFTSFCPTWYAAASPQFHAANAKENNVRRTRFGAMSATAIVVGVGVALSYAQKSTVPFAVAVFISLIFVCGYEYTIRHPVTEG